MTITSRALRIAARLPKPVTTDVIVERDLQIPMPDGAVLVADRWYPNVAGGDRAPIVIARTPYGRQDIFPRIFAEQGFQVVFAFCRGTFWSGGDWNPFFNEQTDGHATLEWISQQPWFSGKVGMFGGSYFGLTQWVVATEPPEYLKAVSPAVTTANFRELFYPGESFALESVLAWVHGVEHQEKSYLRRTLEARKGHKLLKHAQSMAPLADIDDEIIGRSVDFYQDWLSHNEPGDPFWEPVTLRDNLSRTPPMVLTAGWYDLFCPYQLEDYKALRAAGRDVSLQVGAWTHGTMGGALNVVRNAVEQLQAHLLDKPKRKPFDVRIFVMGAKKWINLPDWPPPSTPTRWHLNSNGALTTTAPKPSAPDRYRYDPHDPTPGIGGASLYGKNAGPKDQAALEARPDVLVYSSDELTEPVTVIGELRADVYVRSSLDYFDVFVRLCDVDPKGKSVNICDGVLRVGPGIGEQLDDGSRRVVVPMFPTANTFKKGHRIRVQVSSGAHPLYARNPGSGEPLGKATTLVAADQEIFHDPDHPSAVVLPIVEKAT